ncbi:MAG: hypothetical protein V7707_02885 [Motiliproteus sp.]
MDIKEWEKSEDFLHINYKPDGTAVEGRVNASFGKRIKNSFGRLTDGVFLHWRWDSKTLVIENDRYGLYPLFFACWDDEIIISTSILPILKSGVSLELDYDALSVFFRIGHMLENDTPFKNVHLLPPNSELSWCDGKLSIKQNNTKCFQSNAYISYSEAVEGYKHYFTQSISRRLPEDNNFVVPITGGRDSRHILFELVKQNRSPNKCVTLQYRPPATNEDERIAKIICNMLNLNHEIVDKPECWFSAVVRDIYLTNFCGGGHSWALPLRQYYDDNKISCGFDGLAGDVLSAGHAMTAENAKMLVSGDPQKTALSLLSDSGFEGFNRGAFYKEFHDNINIDRAADRLSKNIIHHRETSNPSLSYTFWNRTRRGISSIPYSLLSNVDVVHCPYLDHDFFDFCTSLPREISLNKNFHDDVINASYPEFSSIPYENKNIEAEKDVEFIKYYGTSIFKYFKYLLSIDSDMSGLIDKRYLYKRIAINLLKINKQQPWYLRRAIYLSELEKIINNS